MLPDTLTPAGRASRAALAPAALAVRLGLHEWQISRAERDGIIPGRDRARGWSAHLADELSAHFAGRRDELRTLVGRVPDLGTWDTAAYLAARFDLDDGPGLRDAVRELARLGALRIRFVDRNNYPVYDGRTIEAVTDPTLIHAAAVSGATLTGEQAATRLRIRRVDFDHAVRAGLIEPCRWRRTYRASKANDPGMWLYRTADVEALADHIDAHWPTLATVGKGARSPLAALPTATKEATP